VIIEPTAPSLIKALSHPNRLEKIAALLVGQVTETELKQLGPGGDRFSCRRKAAVALAVREEAVALAAPPGEAMTERDPGRECGPHRCPVRVSL
jgi:hypothetical protein